MPIRHFLLGLVARLVHRPWLRAIRGGIGLLALACLMATPARAAPAGFAARADASGPLHRMTLALRVQAATADVGKSGQVYVVAMLPDGSLYSLTGSGWVGPGAVQPWQTTTLGSHVIPIATLGDFSGLAGTSFVVGAGPSLAELIQREAFARAYTVGADLAGASAAGVFVTFSINVQDFSYPELSAATVTRIVDLHERYRVPVDIYLSDTMLDLYQSGYASLMARLVASPYVRLNYHIRPPKPYYLNYDWAGLGAMSAEARQSTIVRYESSVVDGTTGQPTARPGGYQQLMTLPNAYPGITAAFQVDEPLLDAAAAAFRSLGATWSLAHGVGVLNLGESSRGLYLRPEHYDLKLFELTAQPAATVIEAAITSAQQAAGARWPLFIGAKMHDNDFFAQKSAWNVVYVDGGKRPPWNPSAKSALKSAAEQAAQWAIYEGALQHVQSQRGRIGVAGSAGIAQLRASAAAMGGARLHVSGTMHIESARTNWPDIDALIAFFRRATAAGRVGSQSGGMKWSIGADIEWLLQEPRAGEVVRTLAPLGVEFDVHAHSAADRARCADRITALGGTPTSVASGLLVSEIDGLRQPATSGATRWQARSLWGLVTAAGHTATSDDTAAGLWRPRSSADWQAHDPAGSLVAVGNGGRTLQAAETLATQVGSGTHVQPVYSVTINVAPKSLQVVGTTDGIAQIESWAARVGAMPAVRWSTIAATAAAFEAQGSLPSRINPAAGSTPTTPLPR